MSSSSQPRHNAGSSSSAPAGSSGSQSPDAQQANATGTQVPRTDQELAQAFRDLARGEQAATALEANLTNLESKLDELLASFENSASGLLPATNGGGVDEQKQQAPPKPSQDGQAEQGAAAK